MELRRDLFERLGGGTAEGGRTELVEGANRQEALPQHLTLVQQAVAAVRRLLERKVQTELRRVGGDRAGPAAWHRLVRLEQQRRQDELGRVALRVHHLGHRHSESVLAHHDEQLVLVRSEVATAPQDVA